MMNIQDMDILPSETGMDLKPLLAEWSSTAFSLPALIVNDRQRNSTERICSGQGWQTGTLLNQKGIHFRFTLFPTSRARHNT